MNSSIPQPALRTEAPFCLPPTLVELVRLLARQSAREYLQQTANPQDA